MKRALGVMLPVLILLFLLSVSAGAAEYKHQFTGATKCKICHMSPKKGNQYGVWAASKHAQAYKNLLTDEAKAAAAKAGKGDKPPAENPAFLKCHVAGADAPAAMLGSKYDKTEGVTCEACHGPGNDYSPMKVMQDKTAALAAGLVLPKKEDCLKCHNPESPTYKKFDYDTFFKQIVHDNPETP